MKPKWICGLYCRLSVEDGNNRESNSIQSQKIILSNYVEELQGAVIGKIYVDDGFSGSNFDRPDFKNMIDAVENGLINCVLVKDYSRFGRDYIDVGYYIEKYFPDKNVRFISVNDNHDSLNGDAQDDLKMPIMNMFNDLQSRETSKKVRSGLKARKQQGKFIGAFAPYGYLKSTEDRNKLIIDDCVVDIVRQIFKWRVDGDSTYTINAKLNELEILTPTAYKNSIGINQNPVNVQSRKISCWNETTVRKILSNEAYIGNVVQNKSTTKNHRTKKKVNINESDWIKVEDTHEPIIDIETWDKVQSMTKKRARTSPTNKVINIFSGVIKCADCGYTMARRTYGNGSAGFTCTTHRRDKNKCTTHGISERILNDAVLSAIMFQIKLAVDISSLIEEFNKSNALEDKKSLYYESVGKLKKELDLKLKISNELYFDLKKGIVTEEQYFELKDSTENEIHRLREKIENLNDTKPKEILTNELSFVDVFERIENKNELTREMVIELIDCVHINEDKSIKIDFKFADEMDTILDMLP